MKVIAKGDGTVPGEEGEKNLSSLCRERGKCGDHVLKKRQLRGGAMHSNLSSLRCQRASDLLRGKRSRHATQVGLRGTQGGMTCPGLVLKEDRAIQGQLENGTRGRTATHKGLAGGTRTAGGPTTGSIEGGGKRSPDYHVERGGGCTPTVPSRRNPPADRSGGSSA